MKQLSCILGLSVVMVLLSACGSRERSPRIVCEQDGKVVPTAFTFGGFKQTLVAEHGEVEATEFTQLKTRSVVVSFKPLDNGTILAERVIALETGAPMDPAVFFGLKNAEISAIQIMTPPTAAATN